ncbi:MAG: NUDIX hydrolase [Myxococcota bacterium]|nr:NUDIX hydrolase [Myxococcota bacterium]
MTTKSLTFPFEPQGTLLLRTERFEVREVPIAEDKTRAFAIHPGSVCILPILDDGRLVVISNTRPTVGQPLLEVVAGTLEPPELPLECAQRELREEAGYEAEEFISMGGFYIAPGLTNEFMHFFIARGLTEVGQSLEPGERIAVRTTTMSEILQRARRGHVRDAKTLAALFRYQLWLGEGVG